MVIKASALLVGAHDDEYIRVCNDQIQNGNSKFVIAEPITVFELAESFTRRKEVYESFNPILSKKPLAKSIAI